MPPLSMSDTQLELSQTLQMLDLTITHGISQSLMISPGEGTSLLLLRLYAKDYLFSFRPKDIPAIIAADILQDSNETHIVVYGAHKWDGTATTHTNILDQIKIKATWWIGIRSLLKTLYSLAYRYTISSLSLFCCYYNSLCSQWPQK